MAVAKDLIRFSMPVRIPSSLKGGSARRFRVRRFQACTLWCFSSWSLCACICMYVCMYVCTYVYIYIYTHTYIYIYIYIYRGSGAPCPPPPTWSMVQHAPPPRPPFVGGSPCGVAVGFWGLGLQVKGKRHRVDMSLGRVWGVGWLG